MNIHFDTISKNSRYNSFPHTQKRNTSFKSSRLIIIQNLPFLEEDCNRTTTCPLRGNIGESKISGIGYDIDWEWWRNFLRTHFVGENIVIHNMACSDGSEAYSHAIALLEGIGNKRNYKVIASDITTAMIQVANEHKINLDMDDIYRMKNFSKSGTNYFTMIDDKPIDFSKMIPCSFEVSDDWDKFAKTYSPASELQEIVSFQNMDMLTHLKQITDKGNSVISCSNVFIYLTKDYAKNFIELLLTKMKSGSIFKTGFNDIESSYSPLHRNKDLYKLLCSKMTKLNKLGTVLQMK